MKAFAIHTRLSQPLQAVFWMLCSGFFFSCLNAEIRYLSAFLHPFEIAFFRSLFGLSFMLPWLFRAGMGGLKTSRLKLYFPHHAGPDLHALLVHRAVAAAAGPGGGA